MLTIFALLLSSFVAADDRYGVFQTYDDMCGIYEQNEKEISEENPITQELNNESIRKTSSRGTCSNEWVCGEWEPCNSMGYQTRQCYDKWQCEEITKLPLLYKECSTDNNVIVNVDESIDSNQEEVIIMPEQEEISNSNNAITGAVVGGKSASWLWILIPIGTIAILLFFGYRKKRN